jgi:hypothetical protein
MRSLLLVPALLLAACSRSHPLEGDYLSQREFLRVTRQEETLVLGIHSREFSTQQPRRLAHAKLAPSSEDGRYSGKANTGFLDGPLTVTRTERGLVLTGDGAPREAVRVDLEQAQPSSFGDADAAALIREQVLETGARLQEARLCELDSLGVINPSAGLTSSKFAHLQQVLAQSQVTIDSTQKQEGLLHDLYSLRGSLVLPKLEWKATNQRLCTKLLHERLKVLNPYSCEEWGTGDVATESLARTVTFELDIEVTRFPGTVDAPPRLEWKRFGEGGEKPLPLEPTSLCRELQADTLEYSERRLRNSAAQ